MNSSPKVHYGGHQRKGRLCDTWQPGAGVASTGLSETLPTHSVGFHFTTQAGLPTQMSLDEALPNATISSLRLGREWRYTELRYESRGGTMMEGKGSQGLEWKHF